jgi:hypothetical protein
MRLQVFRAVGALAIATAVATLTAMTVEGQTPTNNAKTAPAKKYSPPRTADGHPDMQGVWANNSVTPLERPRQWANKQFLTDEEIAEVRKLTSEVTEEGGDAVFGDGIIQAALDRVKNPVSYDPGTGNYNHFWLVERDVEDRRTALITDPADGKIPALTDTARAQLMANAAQRKERPQDNPEDRGLGERCVNFGVPKIGAGYNSYYQVVQAPGHFVFLSEMAHDARIVPVDGRPHVDTKIGLWNGDPRGRWEGDTLVVESTNFSPKSEFRGSNKNLHLVERFTRVGPETLNYEITVTDPTTWTKPWTALIPLKLSNDSIFEYACHEGNYRSMEGSLKGARTLEAEAAGKTGTRQP